MLDVLCIIECRISKDVLQDLYLTPYYKLFNNEGSTHNLTLLALKNLVKM